MPIKIFYLLTSLHLSHYILHMAHAKKNYIVIYLFLACATAHAEFRIEPLSDATIDRQALTISGSFGAKINGVSFQQDAVTSFKGFQYVVYYDANRHLCLARRKLPAGDWASIRFLDYDFKSNDAHNIASLGICPKDGTIHLSWDHHGNNLHYRSSKPGVATDPEKVIWDASLFTPVTSQLDGKEVKSVTYPRFLQTPEGTLQFIYRVGGSGGGDRVLTDYDPVAGAWRNTHRIDSGAGNYTDEFGPSSSRCSYPNGYTYGPDGKLHVTWVWRERTQGANHDLMYAYSEDRGQTWRNNSGEIVGTADGLKLISISSTNLIIWKLDRRQSLMNTQAQAVDAKGRIHAAMWHRRLDTTNTTSAPAIIKSPWSPAESCYYHYWRDSQGKWHRNEIASPVGTRPKLFFDRTDNAYLIYSAKPKSDKGSSQIFNTECDLRIAAATSASQWTDWKIIHSVTGPFVNEMLADPYRMRTEGTLSILIQNSPTQPHQATSLRILDFKITAPTQPKS
jgi:hypothetical protein